MALPDIIKELLEGGVHFGHLSKHWNPKMKKFIFGKKKNVYIIDLEKTAQQLEQARDFVRKLAENNGKILFVATKRQLRKTVMEFALSCQMPYIVERWVGGFITNFATIQTRVKKYIDLVERRDSGGFDKLSGKECVRLNREIERMEKIYRGVITLNTLPDCVFIVDPNRETACVREANRAEIPIVSLIDTDADPELIDYPIPGNDDAIKSVRYIAGSIVEAIQEGIKKREEIVGQGMDKNEDVKKTPEKNPEIKEESPLVEKEEDSGKLD